MLTWLVLGGTGNLGRALCDGDRFVALGSKDLDLTSGRLRISESLARFRARHGALAVLNLAAATSVVECERSPTLAWSVNADGVADLAEVCSKVDLRLVHVSTDYVFGAGIAPYSPTDATCPLNEYGRSKLAGEREVLRRGGVVARMSFLADPPGYAWVADGAVATKEWVDDAARRLRRFCGWIEGLWLSGSNRWDRGLPYHLVTSEARSLAEIVGERYPDLRVVPREEAERMIPFPFPWDVRLSGAWEER